MTDEEHIAQLEMELAKERAKTARVEAELAAEGAENASLRQQEVPSAQRNGINGTVSSLAQCCG
jgi:hypothetical protein